MLTDLPKSVQITLESRVNAMSASEPKIISLSTPADFSPSEGNLYLELQYCHPVLGKTVLDKGPCMVPRLSTRHHPCLPAFSPPLGNHDSELGFLAGKVKGIEFSSISHHKTARIF